jgi:gluconate kinase
MKRVVEARKANPDKQIAVAFALFTKAMREYIRKNTSEPVSFVEISVTKEEYLERSMPRVRDFCKATGNTEE